jgi:hypothetical protein
MSKAEILIAIISSSVLASTLTSFVNWIIHRSNYRNEYYKSILSKRLSAYEQVNSIVYDLSILINMGDYVVPRICTSKEYYDDFIIKVANTNIHSFWVSSRVAGKLTEINIFLINRIENHIGDDDDYDTRLEELGELHMESIRDLRRQLSTLMVEDFRKLYKIRSFLRNNSNIQNEYGLERTPLI